MLKKNVHQQIIIDTNHLQREYFKDLFRFKELLYFFAWRDLLVRYRHTLLGILWIILRPIINMTIFAFVFGKIADLNTGQVNYPLFVLVGLLPWQLFASSLVDASSCLISNASIISKMYFPRILLPISQVIVNLVDFTVSIGMLFCVFILLGVSLPWAILLFPFFVLLTVALCLGTGFWIAAINIRFRDFRVIVPFLLQFGLFISPIGYSSFLVPEPIRYFYFLNPLAGIIEGFRWCCFGNFHPDLPIAITISVAISTFFLITGFNYFRRMERVLADII